MTDQRKGILISFEGPEGSGKTTQIEHLIPKLEKLGHEIGDMVGGRLIHSMATTVKAMTKVPTTKILEEIIARLKDAKEELKIGAELLKVLPIPQFERETVRVVQDKRRLAVEHHVKRIRVPAGPQADAVAGLQVDISNAAAGRAGPKRSVQPAQGVVWQMIDSIDKPARPLVGGAYFPFLAVR